MTEETTIARYEPSGGLLPVDVVRRQVGQVQDLIRDVMKEGQHFGSMPGSRAKKDEPERKVLLKSGAELLNMMFRLRSEFEVLREDLEADRIYYTIRCHLTHIETGKLYATGLGSCSSLETKYRYRHAQRRCPKCGKEAILKSKDEGKGYFCWRKKDGCGAEFPMGDAAIEAQEAGRVQNPDPFDQANTILKMACKRALVAATLNATACSDIFTQDLEEEHEDEPRRAPAKRPPKRAPEARDDEPGDAHDLSPDEEGAAICAEARKLLADANPSWRAEAEKALEEKAAAEDLDGVRQVLHRIKVKLRAAEKGPPPAAPSTTTNAAPSSSATASTAQPAPPASAAGASPSGSATASASSASAAPAAGAATPSTASPPAAAPPPAAPTNSTDSGPRPGPAQQRAGKPAWGAK